MERMRSASPTKIGEISPSRRAWNTASRVCSSWAAATTAGWGAASRSCVFSS